MEQTIVSIGLYRTFTALAYRAALNSLTPGRKLNVCFKASKAKKRHLFTSVRKPNTRCYQIEWVTSRAVASQVVDLVKRSPPASFRLNPGICIGAPPEALGEEPILKAWAREMSDVNPAMVAERETIARMLLKEADTCTLSGDHSEAEGDELNSYAARAVAANLRRLAAWIIRGEHHKF